MNVTTGVEIRTISDSLETGSTHIYQLLLCRTWQPRPQTAFWHICICTLWQSCEPINMGHNVISQCLNPSSSSKTGREMICQPKMSTSVNIPSPKKACLLLEPEIPVAFWRNEILTKDIFFSYDIKVIIWIMWVHYESAQLRGIKELQKRSTGVG